MRERARERERERKRVGLRVKRWKGSFSLFVCAAGKMAPPKGAEGEQKGGKSKGLKKPGRPPKAEKKPVVEGSSKGPGKKGKKAKRSIETYKIYIYKVLKQVALYFPLSFSFFPGLSVFDGFCSLISHPYYFAFHDMSNRRPRELRCYVQHGKNEKATEYFHNRHHGERHRVHYDISWR